MFIKWLVHTTYNESNNETDTSVVELSPAANVINMTANKPAPKHVSPGRVADPRDSPSNVDMYFITLMWWTLKGW